MQPMAEKDDRADPRHRRIRSFVLRQGRFTPAQQRAFEEHWERFGLDPGVVPRLERDVRPRRAAACSKSVSATANNCCGRRRTNRTRDFIGIEVHRPASAA